MGANVSLQALRGNMCTCVSLWKAAGVLVAFLLLSPAEACSFIVTNFNVTSSRLRAANRLSRYRGPDVTVRRELNGWTFVHNLLWMTGGFTRQPLVEEDDRLSHQGSSENIPKAAAVFNGEVYNYQELFPGRQFSSDGEALLPAYRNWGFSFGGQLDGEFAVVIVDFAFERVLLLTDPFSTKPLFFAHDEGGHFAVASYASALTGLGFLSEEVSMAEPNSLYTASFAEIARPGPWINGMRKRRTNQLRYSPPAVWPFQTRFPVFRWNLKQYKQTTEDWINAFRRAVVKRTMGLIWPCFVGLSSGYDSGAIHLALGLMNLSHRAFTIRGKENMTLIRKRLKHVGHGASEIISISVKTFMNYQEELRATAEPFQYRVPDSRWVLDDPASIGLAAILARCREMGVKVYFSGTGADEIISDYAMRGVPSFASDFNGTFPDMLETIFPWRNFYTGVLRNFIMKEETIAGAYGIESRYPFLDRDVVQEYLALAAHVKNSAYKRPVRDFLQENRYPFVETKQGFSVFTPA